MSIQTIKYKKYTRKNMQNEYTGTTKCSTNTNPCNKCNLKNRQYKAFVRVPMKGYRKTLQCKTKDNTSITNDSILLNGNRINQKLKSSYYRMVQRFQYHSSDSKNDKSLTTIPSIGNYNCIYMYSFSVNPQEIKPSGFLSTKKYNMVNLKLDIKTLPTIDRNFFSFFCWKIKKKILLYSIIIKWVVV